MAFSRSQTHADFIGAITPTRVRVARLRIRAVRGMCSDRASHTSGCWEGTISQVINALRSGCIGFAHRPSWSARRHG